MNYRLAILGCIGFALIVPFLRGLFKGEYKSGYIGAWQMLSLLYGGCIMAMAITIPFASQIVDFLNAAAPYVGWGILIAIALACVPSYHIKPHLYGTYGVGDVAYRFMRHDARNGYARYDWQMMEPALGGLLWRATSNIINEHECNYYEVKP